MPLIGFIVALLVIGFILYMIQTAPIPVHPWIRTLISGLIAIALLLWTLDYFGIYHSSALRF